MSAAEVELAWDAVAASVRGPWARAPTEGSLPFVVPASAAPGSASDRGFVFGRIVSARAWPACLEPVNRLAAVPLPSTARGRPSPPGEPVLELDAGGEHHVLCAQTEGAVHWSVDPSLWIQGLLDERYVVGWRRPLPSRLPGLNYARLPHWVKGLVQRSTTADDGLLTNPSPTAVSFPQLPVDDLVETLRRACAALAAGPARPTSPWPDGRRAAVTVTHDVDTEWVLDPRRAATLDLILERESALGLRGAWYVTGQRLDPERHLRALERIAGAGHEIGPHGWNHDAKLEYLSPGRQEARMQRIGRRFAGIGPGAGPEGIRTPWYCRSAGLFEVLARHFRYDSSVPNASGFFSEGTNSGCSSFFPYSPCLLELPGRLRIRDGQRGDSPDERSLFELPMTLPPDGFSDLERGYRCLDGIARRVIDGGGVVVVTMHPQPHQSANAEGLEHFFAFLARLAPPTIGGVEGARLWHATPGEIVARYRAALEEET